MATQNYSMEAVNKILPKIKMYEATHGRRISPDVLDSLIRGELAVGADRDAQNRELALREKSLGLQEQALEDQAAAARVKGATDLLTLGVEGGLAYKYLSKGAAAKTVPAISGLGPSGVPLANAPAFTPGALPSVTAGASGIEYGTGAAAQAQVAPALAPAAQSTAVSAPAAVTPAATAAATEAGGATGLSAVGLSNVALPFAGGAITSQIAGSLGASDVEQGIVGAATGAGIGALVAAGTAVGGPLGAAIGGIIGIGGSLVDDSVICTYLKDTGRLDPSTHRHAHLCLWRHLGNDVYQGYRRMADPLVRLARRNRVADYAVYLIGKHMAQELAHRVRPKRFRMSLFGKAILCVGVPLCRLVRPASIVNRLSEVR